MHIDRKNSISEKTSRKQGFTLVELMIVIIAIGLIIGAVLVGKSLMQTARIQAVVSDLIKYKQANQEFKRKYGYWAGDMPNATSYWATANNGSGNDKIEGGATDTTLEITGGPYEVFGGMEALGLAGFVSGSFTGSSGNGSYDYHVVPGVNMPAAPIRLSFVAGSTVYRRAAVYVPWYYSTVTGNVLYLSGFNVTSLGPGIFADDAYAIDLKMDDGAATTGNIGVREITASECLTSSQYTYGSTTKNCVIYEKLEAQ